MTIAKAIAIGASAAFMLAAVIAIGILLMLPFLLFGIDYLTMHRVYSLTQYAVSFAAFGIGGGLVEWAARKFIVWFQGLRGPETAHPGPKTT